jgi:hypothetical protein
MQKYIFDLYIPVWVVADAAARVLTAVLLSSSGPFRLVVAVFQPVPSSFNAALIAHIILVLIMKPRAMSYFLPPPVLDSLLSD